MRKIDECDMEKFGTLDKKFLLGVGTVLRLVMDAWSMVK